MGKVNLLIKSCLRNEKVEYNIKGILQDKTIKYKDFDKVMIIDLDNKTLERKNDMEIYFFDFKEKTCKIKNKELEVIIPINVVECTIQNNDFYVKYQIENDCFEIEIKQI